MKHVTITMQGINPLLTHNEQLAQNGNQYAAQMKEITSKRKKTDDDHLELARLEFLGGLYLTDDGKVGIPTWNVFRALQDGAKINRLGKQVERGLTPAGPDVAPIQYNGPNTPEAMWNAGHYDQRSVKVGQQKVTRTRPVFSPGWSVTTTFLLDTEVLRIDELLMIARNAGELVGIGDYRPRFGRFEAKVEVA